MDETLNEIQSKTCPCDCIQNVLNKPSSGKIIMVDTGKKMSHSIDDIINTFLRK